MHFQDMISKIQFNESNRQHKRKRLRKVKEAYVNTVELYKGSLSVDKVITREELASLKEKIRLQLKHERRKVIIKSVSFTFFIAGILVLIILWLLKVF